MMHDSAGDGSRKCAAYAARIENADVCSQTGTARRDEEETENTQTDGTLSEMEEYLRGLRDARPAEAFAAIQEIRDKESGPTSVEMCA